MNAPSLRGHLQRLRPLLVLAYLYGFLVSIKLLGHAFSLFGQGFAEAVLSATADPFVGLLAGIIATSVMQSSSTTTSIVVGLVAGGGLTLESAIPVIMGANIGTTVTNTLVSLGHLGHRVEFRRAFSAGILHDFFNVCAVLLLFPLELHFGPIRRTAVWLEARFADAGGLELLNPLQAIIDPAVGLVDAALSQLPYASVPMTILSLVGMFACLHMLTRTMRALMLSRIEMIVHRYLFRNAVYGLVFGVALTVLVQSSSITTSLVVPLAGAGLVTLRQLFPFVVGANLGTTVTAILAALATQHQVAITVAFAHLIFNLFGMVTFYPLRVIPIRLAELVGTRASESRRNLILIVCAYLMLYLLPAALIWLI